MTGREVKEIGLWAVVTAVIVTGVFGAHNALSSGSGLVGDGPVVKVKDCAITASVKPASEPFKMVVTLSAANAGSKAEQIQTELLLVRKDYVGNPMSRIMTPSDYKSTTETRRKISMNVPASKTVTRTITLPTAARPQSDEEGKTKEAAAITMPPTYAVAIAGHEEVPLAQLKAAQVWPKK